ncbi:hypothetical protein l11_08900 [Neisseria weaveri LMG 5135]|nr:hypothetical protein l13_08130 [Neisseria weaveri ATCC 51223]EGV37938.1 hypothetical protein l11_08900 [Neisseria weaveri LMG 5135]
MLTKTVSGGLITSLGNGMLGSISTSLDFKNIFVIGSWGGKADDKNIF